MQYVETSNHYAVQLKTVLLVKKFYISIKKNEHYAWAFVKVLSIESQWEKQSFQQM